MFTACAWRTLTRQKIFVPRRQSAVGQATSPELLPIQPNGRPNQDQVKGVQTRADSTRPEAITGHTRSEVSSPERHTESTKLDETLRDEIWPQDQAGVDQSSSELNRVNSCRPQQGRIPPPNTRATANRYGHNGHKRTTNGEQTQRRLPTGRRTDRITKEVLHYSGAATRCPRHASA